MMSATSVKTKYAPDKKVIPFFTQQGIQISEDGQHIFCQCSNSINIIELDSGNIVKTIESEEDEITALSLAPNNYSLAIGFNSSSIKHYEIKDIPDLDPGLLMSFKSYHRGPVLTMCWDASSVLLATGSSDGSARVWDFKQKFCTHSLKKAQGIIRVLMFDENLQKRPWIYGAANEVIFIWLLQAGSSMVLKKLEGHDSAVMGLQLSHSGEELISCGLDKVIILWDLSTFTSKKIIPIFESLSGIVLKPPDVNFFEVPQNSENSIVFTIGSKGTPRIWDVVDGREIWRATDPITSPTEKEILPVSQIHLVKSLNSIVLTTHDNNIIFIHFDSMQVWKLLVGHNDEILDAIFLGDDEVYTVVASNSPQIRIYENSNSNCVLVTGHTAIVLALANHPVDKYVFGSSSHDNTARIWRLKENQQVECLAVAIGHTHSIGCLTLARDFMVTGSKDMCIKRWNLDLNNMTTRKMVNLSSIRTEKAHEKDINSIALSKDFNLIATSSLDKTAKIWNAKAFKLEGTLQGHRKGIWWVQFSPTECLVATASADATIKLWAIPGFNNIATFEGHEVSVLRVSWICQGLQLVSSGADGLLKVWTLKNNLCVGTFDEHDGRAWALCVADDGRKIVTGGVDSTLIWWRDVTEEEKQKEQEEAQRLVEEEQILMNLLQKKRWSKALRLSLRLKQPLRGLTIMKTLVDESPSELLSVLRRLNKDEMASLVEFAVQWNTKTKNCREAQCVLNYLLKERLPEDLETLPKWQTTLEGLLPYTEKHFKRISALHQSSSILQYFTSCLSLGRNEFAEILDTKREEENFLLQTIPKAETTPVSDEVEMEVSEESSETSEEDSRGSDNEAYEIENITEDAPLESVEDIRSNFTFEKVVAESSEESGNELFD